MREPRNGGGTLCAKRRRSKAYRCPHCGSSSPWRQFLVRSGPTPCPSCGTSLITHDAGSPWALPALIAEVVSIGACTLVVFRAEPLNPFDAGLVSAMLFAMVGTSVVSRGYWVKETQDLSEDEIRSRVRMAEGFVRQGASLREAAEKLSVPHAVLRVWRKRYGTRSIAAPSHKA